MPASYDKYAPRYDQSLQRLEKWFLNNLRKETVNALPHGSRILEIGAGTGANLVLYDQFSSGVATEPSTEMLRRANQKERSAAVQFVQSFGEQLPFRDHSFDCALATLVLCSVESPEQVFAELRRVVRPGGTVSLLEHVRPGGVLGPFFDLLNLITVPLMGDHVNRRTAATAKNSGLKIESVRKAGFGIFNLIRCTV